MERSIWAAAIVLAIASLAGCKEEKSAAAKNAPAAAVPDAPKKLVIENLSPDQAVKTWWKVLDLRLQEEFEWCQKQQDPKLEYEGYVSKISQGAVEKSMLAKHGCEREVYKREIKEVKVETETRAIVLAAITNASPIPEGTVPDKDDKVRREKALPYNYLMEKTLEGWKVTEVDEFDEWITKNWISVLR